MQFLPFSSLNLSEKFPWLQGLAPSIPMEFNFGTSRPFEFDVVAFETRLLNDAFPNAALSFYASLALEQESSLWVPRHPVFYDAYFCLKRDASLLSAKASRHQVSRSPPTHRQPSTASDDDRNGRSSSASYTICSAMASHGSVSSSRNGSAASSIYGDSRERDWERERDKGNKGGSSASSSSSRNKNRSRSHNKNNSNSNSSVIASAGNSETSTAAFSSGSINGSFHHYSPPPSSVAFIERPSKSLTSSFTDAGSDNKYRRYRRGAISSYATSSSGGGGGGGGGGAKDSLNLDADEDALGPWAAHGQKKNLNFCKCIPSRCSSLYLDQALRAATLLGITDTSRVTFGGSDASWEGTGESESEDEDDNMGGGPRAGAAPTNLTFDQDMNNRSMRPQKSWSPRTAERGSISALQGAALASLDRDPLHREVGEEDQYSMAVELSSDELESVDGANVSASQSGSNKQKMSLSKYLEQAEMARRADMARRSGHGNGSDDDADDRSIATSLFVEVASVDEGGSYLGYGAASADESEDDGDDDDEDDDGDYDEERSKHSRIAGFSRASSSNGDHNLSSWASRASGAPSLTPWGGSGGSASSVDSGGHNRNMHDDHEAMRPTVLLSMRIMSHHHSRSSNNGVCDRDLDGYDGASEFGGYVDTDGGDAVDEEEVLEETASQSSAHFAGMDNSTRH